MLQGIFSVLVAYCLVSSVFFPLYAKMRFKELEEETDALRESIGHIMEKISNV